MCLQAADEEELVHLQSLLTQSRAAEAEAVRQAREAAEQLSATSAQHVCQLESDLQQVSLSCSNLCMFAWYKAKLWCNDDYPVSSYFTM